MQIECRSTGQGALTRVHLLKGDLNHRTISTSRSGNHWVDSLLGSGYILLQDITNSGKHHCEVLQIVEGEIGKVVLSGFQKDLGLCVCEFAHAALVDFISGKLLSLEA